MGKRKTGQPPISHPPAAPPLPHPRAAGTGESDTIVSIELETPMTTSIGVVMTEHIVAGLLAGPLGHQKLEGERLRYPADPTETEALIGIPSGELYEILVSQIAPLVATSKEPVSAIGVAVPG